MGEPTWQPVPEGVDVTASPNYPQPEALFDPVVDRAAAEPIGEVVARLRKALDELEEIAETTRSGGYYPDTWEVVPSRSRRWSEITAFRRVYGEPPDAPRDTKLIAYATTGRWEDELIALNDPASTLARVAAYRQILALWEAARDLEAETAATDAAFGRGMTAGLERAVRALAAGTALRQATETPEP